jgi:3-mercaptopyruvate sulfurtransferase SseA
METLPVASPNKANMFGVDKNININTIDDWLGRDDVAYIDVRMLIDPGDYRKIGGDPILSGTIEGFEVVPYPYLANLTGLPPQVAASQYDGPTLFTLTWDKKGNIDTLTPNYEESEMIIKDLFPQDKAIFLLCGGGGYASFTRALLIKLGYDPDKLYNIGGFWFYKGNKAVNIKVSYGDNKEYYAFHRLKYHYIDFDQLHKK